MSNPLLLTNNKCQGWLIQKKKKRGSLILLVSLNIHIKAVFKFLRDPASIGVWLYQRKIDEWKFLRTGKCILVASQSSTHYH